MNNKEPARQLFNNLSNTVSRQNIQEYSRTNPFKAEILENLNLNGRGSNKETRHLELSLEGSNLEFEPGDSLGIYPENDTELVDALIAEMSWNASETVKVNKQGELSATARGTDFQFRNHCIDETIATKSWRIY